MQTTPSTKKSRNYLTNLGLLLGLALAVALFVAIIGRLGLLSFDSHSLPVLPGHVTVETQDFQFDQTEMRLKVGEQVTLQLGNSDLIPHSFDVDEFDVHQLMPVNEQVSASFTPSVPGTYTFYCGIPGHREAGMVGTLIVTE